MTGDDKIRRILDQLESEMASDERLADRVERAVKGQDERTLREIITGVLEKIGAFINATKEAINAIGELIDEISEFLKGIF